MTAATWQMFYVAKLRLVPGPTFLIVTHPQKKIIRQRVSLAIKEKREIYTYEKEVWNIHISISPLELLLFSLSLFRFMAHKKN